jgi:hypothetical protein
MSIFNFWYANIRWIRVASTIRRADLRLVPEDFILLFLRMLCHLKFLKL